MWKILREINCESSNCIYLIECHKDYCKKTQNIGETGRAIRIRFSEHKEKEYIRNTISKATWDHFKLPGHSVNDVWCLQSRTKQTRLVYLKPLVNLLIK